MKILLNTVTISILLFALALQFCGKGGDTESAGTTVQTLESLTPADNEAAAWVRDSAPRFFDDAGLWEYINGAADGYLVYGFERVMTTDFNNSSIGKQAVVDIYEMKDPLNAFGIYADERNPGNNFETIGIEGYLGGAALMFWKGKFYVKITAFEEDETLMREIRKLADCIAGKITDTTPEPKEFSFFPGANKLARMERYIPSDILGQSFLSNGFESYYRDNDTEYKIVLIKLESPEDAVSAFARYKEFIASSGKILNEDTPAGDGGFTGEDSFYGKMMAVHSGNYIAAILPAPSDAKGKTALQELVSRIN